VQVAGVEPGKLHQRHQATAQARRYPGPPPTQRRLRVAKTPELFEVILQDIGDERRAIRSEELLEPHAVGAPGDVRPILQQQAARPFDDATSGAARSIVRPMARAMRLVSSTRT